MAAGSARTRAVRRHRPERLQRKHAALSVGALLIVLSGGCSAVDLGPVPVTLSELVAEQDRYDGRHVIAEGLVRTFDDPRHYWIEDDDVNRVEIVPEDAVADHVGAVVRVTGRFTFRDDEGRRITIDELEVVTAVEHAAGSRLRFPQA
jgi:hypothetical protein